MIYLEVLLKNRGVRLNKGLKRAFGKASQSEYDIWKKYISSNIYTFGSETVYVPQKSEVRKADFIWVREE